jgi:uncharacterized phage protein gp47/JayE
MSNIRTTSEVIAALKATLATSFPQLELTEGTPEYDLFLQAPGVEFGRLYDESGNTSADQAISTASPTGLQRQGENFSKPLRSATKASGYVNFFRNTLPVTNATVPIGTVVSTVVGQVSSSTPVQFRTTEEVTMYVALGSTYINTTTGKYEISVQVEAVIPGSGGIVGASTITTILTAVSGFDGVYNPVATSGGTNDESSTDYAARLAEALAGNNVGTSSGYLQTVMAQDGVEDAYVSGNGQSERDELGAVDVVFEGEVVAVYTEVYSPTDPVNPADFQLTKQPVIADGAFTLIDSNVGVLAQDVDWSFVPDTSVYGGSVSALGKIHFNGPFSPALGSINVKYQYNSLVTTLQSLLNNEQYRVENASVLVIWATKILVDVEVRIRVLPGFDSVAVQTDVMYSIAVFLNVSHIGSEVQQADIAREILNTPGVDDVTLPFTTLQSSDGTIVRNSDGNLTIPSNSYASSGTIAVTIMS